MNLDCKGAEEDGCIGVVFGRGEDPEEVQVACVFCGAAGPASTLECLHCQSTIPFCLATGRSSAMLLEALELCCLACFLKAMLCAACLYEACTTLSEDCCFHVPGLCLVLQLFSELCHWVGRQAHGPGRLDRVPCLQVPGQPAGLWYSAGYAVTVPTMRSRSQRSRFAKRSRCCTAG